MSSEIEMQNIENVVDTTEKKVSRKRKNVDGEPKKARRKKKKVEYDENGNEIKKVRQTNKVKYPKVKTQPRTAYMFFMSEVAKEAQENPDKEKLDTKKISQLWNATEDRSKWEEMAKADKQRFFDEARAHGYEIKEKKKEPSRPCSAFLLYARDHQREYRDKHGVTYLEALSALGEIWSSPDFEEQRKPYLEDAERRKEEWKAKKEEAESKANEDAA